MGLGTVFTDFALWSTVGGVPHIANAQTKITRFFWIFVFASMVIVFLVELYIMLAKYFSYPAQVSTTIDFSKQKFPVVTVCNLNPYKYSVISSDGEFAEIAELMKDYSDSVRDNYLQTPPASAGADKWNLRALWNETYEIDATARDALILEMAKLSPTVKAKAVYSHTELIAECSFSSNACKESDFHQFIDPVYGACYSFNGGGGGGANNATFESTRAGMKFGLKLLLTPKQNLPDKQGGALDVLPTSKLAGARVSVHADGSFPSLEGSAISVGVGYQTAVSLTLFDTIRAKKPYGNCVDRESESSDYYSDYTYTMETCFLGCKQRYNVERCGCAHPRYRTASGADLCSTKENLLCIQNLKGDQSDKNDKKLGALQDCGCHPPCQERSFSATTSLSRFPSDKYFVAADATSSEAIGPCSPDTQSFRGVGSGLALDPQKSKDCRQWYEENALLLQVYFDSLKFETYTEGPAYGISDVINDLGGHAGLWLGLSVISVVELLGLFWVMILYCFGGKKFDHPDEEAIESDERMKNVNEVEREIDQYDNEHEKNT